MVHRITIVDHESSLLFWHLHITTVLAADTIDGVSYHVLIANNTFPEANSKHITLARGVFYFLTSGIMFVEVVMMQTDWGLGNRLSHFEQKENGLKRIWQNWLEQTLKPLKTGRMEFRFQQHITFGNFVLSFPRVPTICLVLMMFP